MSERMGDERFDHEMRGFLAWQAEDVAGAPSAVEVATRISARAGTATARLRVVPQLAWVLLAGLLVVALLGALATGANRQAPAPPLAVIDVSPSAAPDSRPSSPASPAPASHVAPPTTTPAAAGSLPVRRFPGTRLPSSPGEYGWEGAAGQQEGMHRVIGDGTDGHETSMVFAVGPDCLATSGKPQVPVRVAGFDGVAVEPYEPPVVFGTADGDEITRAYALAVGDRTLCIFVTWRPATPDDERDAALRIVDTLRAEPIGEDRIRIIFDPGDGWDSG